MLRVPVYPLLFAAFPILSLYAHNQSQVAAVELWWPLGLAMGATALFWGLVAALTREAHRSAVIAGAAALLFLSFGKPRAALAGSDGGIAIPALQLLWLLFFAVTCAVFLRWRSLPASLEKALQMAGVVLVLLPVVSIGNAWLTRAPSEPAPALARPARKAPTSRPDIYYLVLDGYGSSEILRNYYGFDNRSFLAALEERGFYVARRSCANYGQTLQSLASSLNLDHLHELIVRLGPRLRDRGPLRELVANSRLVRLLEEYGYTIVAFESGYSGTELRDADRYLAVESGLSEFENALLNTTPIPLFLQLSKGPDQHDRHRARVLFALESLGEVARIPGPKLVFDHIVSPHPPFVFEENGEPLPHEGHFHFTDGSQLLAMMPREEYVRAYRGQARFITSKALEAVDAILRSSSEPPVIVIQGDHGPGSRLIQSSVEKTDVVERLCILNAYHLPGGGAEELYPEITPVNSFRLILRRYLGEDLPPVEDRSYLSTWLRPYDLVDVTPRLAASPLAGDAAAAHPVQDAR
jgi:hypothetical protein